MKTLFLLVAVCAVMSAQAVTYYISPVGDDSNDGLSPGTAFGTFLHATETMVDGDTLIITEGVYTNPGNRAVDQLQLMLGQQTNGTFLNNITVMGEGPDKTIFRYVDGIGQNVTDAYHVSLRGNNNLLTGIKLEGDILGDGWWVAPVTVHNGTDLVVSHVWVEFPDTITGRIGISSMWVTGVDNVLIYRCLVDGGGAGGRVFNWDKFHNMTFRNCTFVNQREGGGDRGMGMIVEGNSGTVIENCIFAYNVNYGISFWNPHTDLPQATQTVANCLYWDPGQGFIDLRDPARVYVIESGTVNQDPQFQNDPKGLPYSVPLTLADYGWNVVPEPAGILVGLLALGMLLRRRS